MLPSAELVKYLCHSSRTINRNKKVERKLNYRDPIIDYGETSNKIYSNELKLELILVLCL